MLPLADVSRHQGWIDWERFAPAIAGVWIRATLGAAGVDDRYAENWREAAFHAVPRAPYHYQTRDPGREQVANIRRVTQDDYGNKKFVVDCERTRAEREAMAAGWVFPRAAYTENLRVVCYEISARAGRAVRVYSNQTEIETITTQPSWLADFGFHVAAYPADPGDPAYRPRVPAPWSGWEAWQYTSSGRLPGIAGNVDLNREFAVRKLCLQTLGTSSDIFKLPAGAVKLVDDFGSAAEHQARGALVVGRVYVDAEPDVEALAAALADPERAAQDYWDAHCAARVAAHPAVDAWEGPNERTVSTPAGMGWYAAFEAARTELLAAAGKRAVVGNFAVGNPEPELWPHFQAAIDAIRRRGGWLGLHEYWLPGLEWDGYHGGRLQRAPDAPKLVTECGFDFLPDLGRGGGWRTQGVSAAQYADSLLAYDAHLRARPDVGAAFIFHATASAGLWPDYNVEGAGVVERLAAVPPAVVPLPAPLEADMADLAKVKAQVDIIKAALAVIEAEVSAPAPLFRVQMLPGKVINIRAGPSTSFQDVGDTEPEAVYAVYQVDTDAADGVTGWYRIHATESRWISGSPSYSVRV